MISILILCVAAAFQSHAFLLQRANTVELKALAEQIVSGAEKSIDYAILTMFELDEVTQDLCSENGRLLLSQAVHKRSVVKDVKVLDDSGRVRCSAFPETLGKTAKDLNRAEGMLARNSDFALFNMNFADRKILGVARYTKNSDTLLVLIDVEAQLFAAFPSSIRDHMFGTLKIGNRDTISSVGMPFTGGEATILSEAPSSRFPINFNIIMEEMAFLCWNNEFEMTALWFGFGLGILLIFVLFRELRRPATDREQIFEALERNEIQPYFQPIQCSKRGTISSCEVLARWIKPDGTVVSPVHFIPMAEATGTVVPMTRKLVQLAFQQLRTLLQSNAEFSIAFNITPSDFAAHGFVGEMLGLTQSNGILPTQVTLEITEREGFADIQRICEAVQQARSAGFSVSLDDTGTGHNGLSQVQDISADVIKIDKKFVDLIGIAPSANAIVDMLVGLAHRLSMKTVAEGVESQAQIDALKAAGVDCFQGYFISKPLPASQFIAFYNNEFSSIPKNAAKPPLKLKQLVPTIS